jgi:hydrogenase 3 maturation protease
MYEILKKTLVERLRGMGAESVVLVGVGNRMRGDDGIGPILIDLLKGEVLKPSVIIFLDAASLREAPGSARVVEAGEVEKLEASAHNFSLDVVMEYLKASTGADVFLVGIQPGRVGEGEGISRALQEPLKEIADILKRSIKKV